MKSREKKKSSVRFAAPETASSNERTVCNLHILGICLSIALSGLLSASLSIMWHSIRTIILESFSMSDVENAMSGNRQLFDIIKSVCDFYWMIWDQIKIPYYIWIYGRFGWTLFTTVILLVIMKKVTTYYVKDGTDPLPTVEVKKKKYVLLGLLLGSFGAHFFAMKKRKRGFLFLILGILGLKFNILMWYTLGISFADAFLACTIKADLTGRAEVPDYPNII